METTETISEPRRLWRPRDRRWLGGVCAGLGRYFDLNPLIFNMLTVKGIYGREMYETWYQMTVMLQSGLDITPIITHHFPYTDFEKGFEVMSSAKSGKVILAWDI